MSQGEIRSFREPARFFPPPFFFSEHTFPIAIEVYTYTCAQGVPKKYRNIRKLETLEAISNDISPLNRLSLRVIAISKSKRYIVENKYHMRLLRVSIENCIESCR